MVSVIHKSDRYVNVGNFKRAGPSAVMVHAYTKIEWRFTQSINVVMF